jgi:hypothetical protein
MLVKLRRESRQPGAEGAAGDVVNVPERLARKWIDNRDAVPHKATAEATASSEQDAALAMEKSTPSQPDVAGIATIDTAAEQAALNALLTAEGHSVKQGMSAIGFIGLLLKLLQLYVLIGGDTPRLRSIVEGGADLVTAWSLADAPMAVRMAESIIRGRVKNKAGEAFDKLLAGEFS